MKTAVKILISLLTSAVCLYFATRNVQWAELKIIIVSAKMAPIFIGLMVSTVTFYLRAIRWQILLQPFQKIPAFQLLRWQVGGLLINNLVPLRMGEFARAYWAGHKTSIPKSTMLATIVAERLLDIISIALIAIVFLAYSGLLQIDRFLKAEVVAVLALIFIAFIFAAKFSLNRNLHSLKLKLKEKLPEKIYLLVKSFLSGLKIFKDKTEIVKVAFLSPLIWCIDITVIFIISKTLEMQITWIHAGLVIVGLVLGVMVPAAPGAAGTYEAGGVGALVLIGVSKTLALSFILLLHSFQFLYVLVIGIPILIAEGFSPKKIMEEAGEPEKNDLLDRD